MERRGYDRKDARSPPASERKGHKRKLEDADLAPVAADGSRSIRKLADTDVAAGPAAAADGSRRSLRADVRAQVDILKRCVSSSKADRVAARRAAQSLGEFAMQVENVGVIVEEGAVSALVQHLRTPTIEDKDGPVPCEHEVEKDAAFALGLLAVKSEHQQLIAEAGALRHLVSLLQRKASGSNARMVNGVIRRAADAIANLAHDNNSIQMRLRTEGGIPLLEALLESTDRKVQRAATGALRTLAAKKEGNKSLQRNGSRGVATDLEEHPQMSLSQRPRNTEPAEMAGQGNSTGGSSRTEMPSLNSKGWSLNTPEAIAKAKLALEKQKMLAEKLKKIPQVSHAAAQSSTASFSLPVPVTTSLPTAVTHASSVGQTLHSGSAGFFSSGTLPTSMNTISTGVNLHLPNFPGLVSGMAPVANIEALKRVQEVAARLGIPQNTESFPFLSMIQRQSTNELGTAGQQRDVKRPVLLLDAQGREIDEHGNVVERTKISNLSTLKVNINKHKKESFQILHPELEEDPINNRFFDPDMGVDKKKLVRPKRPSFQFVVEGSLAKQAEISRMKSRFGEAQAKEIKMKQAALAKAKAEADINPNLIEVSERFPIKEKTKDPIPDVEWWDAVLLPSGTYQDVIEGEPKVKMEKLTIYVEHPVPIEPPAEPAPPPPQPLKLTKKERKKLRTQRRLAKEKDRQEMIRQGLLEPPKPKVKMSNLMKVLGAEATQDPTKLEMEIRSAAAEREQAHTDRNLARKLTPAERREKKERKLFDDPNTLETVVSVYRVNDLSHVQTRFKVDINAQENRLTGCIVMCDTMTVVVVEGGSKSIKRYGKLMLHRIKWATAVKENDEADNEGPQQRNRCVLVWQGSVAKPNFEKFIVQQFRTEAAARKFLVDSCVGHYWDLAANFIEE